MFGMSSKTDKIPIGYIPADKLGLVLTDLGFGYLATIEFQEVKDQLLDSQSRDTSHGPNMVSVEDLLKFLSPHIDRYTNKQELVEAVNYFDTDKDGQLQPDELESMLLTFNTEEHEYLDTKQIREIVKLGQNSKSEGQVQTDKLVNNIWQAWQKHA